METEEKMPALKVVWHPNFSDNKQPGSHFYVQYRRKGETLYENSAHELSENFIVLRGLEANQLYEIRVVSVDGDFSVPSETEEVELAAGAHELKITLIINRFLINLVEKVSKENEMK